MPLVEEGIWPVKNVQQQFQTFSLLKSA